MNITKKDIDSVNAVITVRIEKEDYSDKVAKLLQDYRKKANIPGFRPGNVPLGMIKRMYEKAIKVEEINNMVSTGLMGYIEEENLNVIGEPLLSKGLEITEQDFDTLDTFDFHFDVAIAPTFDIELSSNDVVPYYEIIVSDDMIEQKIKSYTSMYGKYELHDTIEEHYLVKGDFTELENGEVKTGGIDLQNVSFSPDVMSEEQKNLFIGKSKGDVIEFNPTKAFGNISEISSLLRISKDEAQELTSDFRVEIKEISSYSESEIDQNLFDKVYGEGVINSEQEFKDKIIENLKEGFELNSDTIFNSNARDMLIRKNKGVSFPDAFMKRWLLSSNKKMTEEKLEEIYPKIEESYIWEIIKNKIAVENDLAIEYADIEKYAKKIAKLQLAQYGLSDLDSILIDNYAQSLLNDEEHRKYVINNALNEKVFEVIREKVKLDKKRISVEDFNKLLEQADEKAPENI